LEEEVEYNYEKFGDTPACLDQGLEDVLKTATVRGAGTTETGDKGILLETNVTVITNQQCKDILEFNVTDNLNIRKKLLSSLPLGLDYRLLCVQGILNPEKGIFSGACKHDSGGPLTQEDENGRTTLIGVVSGGIDCGKGYPGWYTRVEYYTSWIQCIMDKSNEFSSNSKAVNTACTKVAWLGREQPLCEKLVADPDVALFNGIDGFEPEEICFPYRTGSFARADDEPKVEEVFQPAGVSGGTDYQYPDDDIFGGEGDSPDDDIFGDGGDDYNDDIFGDEGDAAGGDDYSDDIFGDS